MGVVVGRQTPTGHEQRRHIFRHEAPIGNIIRLTLRQILPLRVASRVVVFDRRAAFRHGIIEFAGREHVGSRETILSVDATALTDADLIAEIGQEGLFIARDVVVEEPGVLERLAAPFHLGPRELFRIGRIHVADAGHVRSHDAGERRDVDAAFSPGQVVYAGLGGLVHQVVQQILADRTGLLVVHAHHPERRGEGLDRPLLRTLERRSRESRHVGISRRIHHAVREDLHPASFRGGDHARHAVAFEHGVHYECMEQQSRSGLQGQRFPDDLERLRIVGDPVARTVGVGPDERDASSVQLVDDEVGDPTDDLLWLATGRKEAVEGVQHLRTDPAHKAVALDDQRVGTRARGGDGGRRTGRTTPDDEYFGAHRGGDLFAVDVHGRPYFVGDLSSAGPAAVDRQNSAGDEGRAFGCQKERGLGDVDRIAEGAG